MSLRDLKQLEGRLEKGINKIRTKKVIIFTQKDKGKEMEKKKKEGSPSNCYKPTSWALCKMMLPF